MPCVQIGTVEARVEIDLAHPVKLYQSMREIWGAVGQPSVNRVRLNSQLGIRGVWAGLLAGRKRRRAKWLLAPKS